MADADKVLKILVEMGVVGQQDVEQAKQSLVDVAKDTHELGEKTKEAAEHTEKFTIENRELREVLNIIGEQAGPQVATALAAVGAVAGGEMFFAIIAIQQLLKWMEEARKESEDWAEEMQNGDFAEGMAQMAEAIKKAKKELEVYAAERASLAANEVTIASAMESQLMAMNAMAAAQERLAAAQEALNKAKLDQDAALHRITPDQKTAAEAVDAVQAAKDETAAGKKKSADDIATRQSALDEAKKEHPQLEKAWSDALMALNRAQGHNDELQDAFGIEKGKTENDWYAKRDERLRKETGLTPEDVERMKEMYTAAFAGHPSSEHDKEVVEQVGRYERERERLERGHQQWRNSQSESSVRQMVVLEQAEKDAKERLAGADKIIKESPHQIADLQTKKAIDDSAADAELQKKIETIITNAVTKIAQTAEPAGEMAMVSSDAQAIAVRIKAGKPVTNQEAAAMEHFANDFAFTPEQAMQGQHFRDAYAAADWVNKNLDTQQKVFDLIQRLLNLHAQAATATTAQQQLIQKYESRINELEQEYSTLYSRVNNMESAH